MSRQTGYATAFVLALMLVGARPASAADPLGTWLTEKSDARIQITRCGNGICGTVVWLKEPIDPATGKPQVDGRNPDPSRQNRKIIGLRIFSMPSSGPDTWGGNIYNSDDGKTYTATIKLPRPSQLEVRGCVGPFCGSEMWTRR